ncbi:hypothetical protein [Corynebacterium efficiens YS-314]|uniref:Uncharacterized protein n=1 Tax=Corynebacterium efficiens (strain DSM 44549 / YS-314 / AJ 12310 / JCM 11189 / NBRC 100395) TaxID=196164 RepID=Q8FS98_COREF|nr:hypothetical protein [Corynebacterium efficiens YS-314]
MESVSLFRLDDARDLDQNGWKNRFDKVIQCYLRPCGTRFPQQTNCSKIPAVVMSIRALTSPV